MHVARASFRTIQRERRKTMQGDDDGGTTNYQISRKVRRDRHVHSECARDLSRGSIWLDLRNILVDVEEKTLRTSGRSPMIQIVQIFFFADLDRVLLFLSFGENEFLLHGRAR